jgi:Ni/Co efflux regulator RcnB
MMHNVKKSSLRLAILGLALSLVAGNALADKSERAERGKHREAQEYRDQNNQAHRYRNTNHRGDSAEYRFRDSDRRAINTYYRDEKRRDKCPPGLAKKNKHCQPPGQYKKWHKGKPIAKHVRYEDLPRGLRSRLSAPQDNYRYVRVDDDILLVDRVTNVVIDVMENILR